MKVAHVIQSYPPVLGGAQRQVQRLGPLLEQRGVAGTVITRRPPGTPRRAREPGLDVLRIPAPAGAGVASAAYSVGGIAALARLRPDVIHVYDLLSPGTIALAGGGITGAPVVAKVLSEGHGGDVDRLLHKPLGARRLALEARRFAAFICLSGDVERELTSHGVPRERLRRIPNGVDSAAFRPPRDDAERAALRAGLGVPGDGLLSLYCGRFADVKQVDVLVAAFRDAPGRLLLVGNGSETGHLRGLAADPALGGRVVVRDAVEDPAPLYRAADLYLSASGTEGMSGSVLEAMASGLPVVAAAASGMDELLGSGCGVQLPQASPAGIAEAVAALDADPGRRAGLAAAALARVQASYALDAVADRLVALYEEVRAR